MANTFIPRIKPGVRVDQFITASARTPVKPALPSVVIGVQNLVQKLTALGDKYTGSTRAFLFPNFESGAKVNTSSLSIKLSGVTVAVLGVDEALTGSVDAPTNPDPHKKRFIYVTGKTGIFIGVKPGDTLKAVEDVTSNINATVDATALNTITKTSGFTSAQPGDIITVTDPSTSIVKVATIIQVATGGGSAVVDTDLIEGTSLNYSVTRKFEALVKAVVTDQKLELTKELSMSGTNINTFVIERTLVAGATNVGDQPLTSGSIALTSSQYSLSTVSTTNDAFVLPTNIRITGFTGFNAYPIVPLTVQLEVDTTNTVIKNQTSATSPIIFADVVKVGSIVLFDSIPTRFKVVSINTSTNKITLDSSPASTGTQFTSFTVPSYDKPVIDATVSTAFTALRTANANKFMEVPTDDLIESIAGVYDPSNPIGVGVTAMAANTGTSVYFVPVASDDEVGYLAALAALESKFVYNVCALSQSLVIQSFVKSHVDAMSTPIKGRWRVGWGNLAEPTEGLSPKAKGGSLILNVTAGTPPTGTAYLYDARANFTSSVSIGDYIKVFDQANVAATLPSAGSQSYVDIDSNTRYFRIYRVIEKVNASKLKLEVLPYQGSDAIYTNVAQSVVTTEATTYIVEYESIQVLTRTQQANTIASVASSFSDRRFIYVTNGSCIFSFKNTPVEVSGAYLAAALAGLSAGTLPHQPLTNYPISGLVGVRGGSEKYDDTQQGIIAAGGGWLVVQDELDKSVPYTWQQLTTSQGGIKEQEFSFTKNLDEISYGLSLDNARFPGRNNIVPETLAAIESQARATLEVRKTTRYNSGTGGFLGSQIIDYTFGNLIQDPFIADLVYNDITVELPLPLNTINFRLLA